MKIELKLLLAFWAVAIFVGIVGFYSNVFITDPAAKRSIEPFVFTFVVTIILFFGMFISHSISKPIKELRDAASVVAAGKLDVNVDIKTKDEMGELSNTFNHMVKELDKTNKLKAEFLNIAAHELNTPLIPIVGYTEVLLKDAGMPDKFKENLAIILESAQMEQSLVDDILSIAKMESGSMEFEMKDVKMADMIKDAVKEMMPGAGKKGVEVVTDVQENLPLVHADGWRTSQVMRNLLDNAIKFTDKGRITVRAVTEGDSVVASVEDTGIGISEEDVPKLFTKFFQADTSLRRKHEGTGLGLSIVKMIVEAHGGKVWVKSKQGEGSVFSFSLPVKKL